MTVRTWTYSYKTSDGLRHEAEMDAPTKDDVYAALRERGIRAIRVTERIAPVVHRGFAGLRRREWMIVVLSIVALVAVVAIVVSGSSSKRPAVDLAPASSQGVAEQLPSAAFDEPHFCRLAKSVEGALVTFRESAASLDVSVLAQYQLLTTREGERRVRQEIEQGRKTAEAGRSAVDAVYDMLYDTIPAENAEAIAAAQKLFGAAMAEIDVFAEALDADECAMELMIAHRGAWRIEGGAVKWDDPRLEREFTVFHRAGAAKTFFKIPH